MKYLSTISCIIILALLTNCQSSHNLTPRQKWWKYQDKMTKMFPTTPPNGVWLRDSIFLDKTEVANIDYLDFLYFIKDSSAAFQKAMKLASPPWEEILNEDNTISYTYTHLFYCPVAGISYQQVQAYCKWRTDAVNLILKNPAYASHANVKLYRKLKEKYDIEYCCRLPTLEEWNYALATDLLRNAYGIDTANTREFPYRETLKEIQKIMQKEKGIKLSYKQIKADISKYNEANPYYNRINYYLTEPPYFDEQYVNSKRDSSSYSYPSLIWRYNYYTHGRGFYNLVGNAAEMVTSGDSIFVIGGSFLNTLDELKPPNKGVYTKPEAYIGFRCVAEMKIKAKK